MIRTVLEFWKKEETLIRVRRGYVGFVRQR